MNEKIIICLQMSPIDEMAALALAELIADIEPTTRNDVEFCISARRGTNPEVARTAFDSVSHKFEKVHMVNGLRTETGWPHGCNALWSETMMRLSCMYRDGKTTATGVLTIEADCLPLRADWIDIMKAEWNRARFAGFKICGHHHGFPKDHVNGNGIFYIKLTKEIPKLNGGSDGGWDYAHRKALMPISVDTPYIFQIYRMGSVDLERLMGIRKQGKIPALFHGIKGLQGINLVRGMLKDGTLKRGEDKPKEEVDTARYTEAPEPRGGKIRIFIRSYVKDFGWLEYCLRSIRQNVTGHAGVTILIPEEDLGEFKIELQTGEELKTVSQKTKNGYVCQQLDKMHADLYCEEDYILMIDSDCVFPTQFDCESMISNGLPWLLVREWENLGDAKCWKVPTEEVLKISSEYETMARLPIVYHRSTLALLRDYIQQIHGTTLADLMSSMETCSEFNIAGNFILKFIPHHYRISPPGAEPYPQVSQKWSWGGLTADSMAQCENELRNSEVRGASNPSDVITRTETTTTIHHADGGVSVHAFQPIPAGKLNAIVFDKIPDDEAPRLMNAETGEKKTIEELKQGGSNPDWTPATE